MTKQTAASESQATAGAAAPKVASKQQQLAALVVRDEGATLAQMIAATGWLPHTTRAALTWLRKRGLIIEKERGKDDKTAYRIVGDEAATTRKTRRAA